MNNSLATFREVISSRAIFLLYILIFEDNSLFSKREFLTKNFNDEDI